MNRRFALALAAIAATRLALAVLAALVCVFVLATLWTQTHVGCTAAPLPGWEHYPTWLQAILETRCNA